MTALDCIGELLTAQTKNGLVLGAMQSGKTTTSLALQFAGPIVYLLTGRCLYPIYLITSHTSQEDQTKHEMNRFLDFYGDLRVEVDNKHCTLIEYVNRTAQIDQGFVYSPTISTYREHVLKSAFPDVMTGPRLEDFIQRRAMGDSIKRVADLCRRANSKHFSPLLIIDEPQYGASDRLVVVDGEVERRPCVLLQVFDRIQEALGGDAPDHVFIGLSATPYELHDIEAVWKVRQYLTSAYSGFNYFGGKVIDASAEVTPPNTISFAELGYDFGLPFMSNVSLAAYDATPETFRRFAKKINYLGTQDEYREEVEKNLRVAIMRMARSEGDKPVGICIRLFNNNNRSQQLIRNLFLNRDEIDVVEYFGPDHRGQSVKRAIAQRARPDLPFLIAVTNRARMGDAFPNEVRWFLEFSKKAADLNALLQGLLGRACGYGKNSTVVMSEENLQLVRDYTRSDGGYIYKTSRHSVVVGTYRRGAPTSLIRLYRNSDDPVVREYFKRIDEEIVAPTIIQGSARLSTKRNKGGFRTGPVLRIANELGLFEHLEKPEVREMLFPTYPEFEIARADDEVVHSRDASQRLRYEIDDNGDCRFTFRELGTDGAHGGVRSRGLGKRDAADRAKAGNKLEPQVNLVKLDPSSGEVIYDRDAPKSEQRPGNWRSEMVTLPLRAPVRELQAGKSTLPVKHSPYAALLSEPERKEAGYD
ncbi:MAG: hypothetical protein ACK4FK_05695 [Ferrovibrio sp.]|uniref:hypothetical protein n=1 Tax=Ferrovibrio sp. TaxID=1917215 RepID=UPI00391D3D4C